MNDNQFNILIKILVIIVGIIVLFTMGGCTHDGDFDSKNFNPIAAGVLFLFAVMTIPAYLKFRKKCNDTPSK